MKCNLLILLTILFISCQERYSAGDFDLVINNVKLFDGDSVFENVTVLVQGDSISKILNDKNDFRGENVIEGQGMTMIPGLINAHSHAENPKKLKEAAASGVLTLLNLFTPSPAQADSLRAYKDSIHFAYFYSSGPGLTVPGGHGSRSSNKYAITKTNQIDNFIKSRISENSDYIKVLLERGSDGTKPTLNDSMLISAFKAANDKHLISITHISRRSDAIKALNSGASGLAHLWWRDSIPISQSELDLFSSKEGFFIIPTLLVNKLAKKYESIDFELMKDDLLKLHNAGISIVAGTDPPNFGINHGTDLYQELELMVVAGLSDLEALKTATSEAAKCFGLKDHGFIKVGKSADFLLINGDPTQDIKEISKIHSVWKMGKQITPYNKH